MKMLYMLLIMAGVLFMLIQPTPEISGEEDNSINSTEEDVTFENVTYEAGLKGVSMANIAWGDYNGDGYEDFVINGRRLFRNNGPPNWDFTETTNKAGFYSNVGYSGIWGDYDNDGDLDLFTCTSRRYPQDILWRNNGDGTFTNVTEQAGINDVWETPAAGWGDYDDDGYIDLYIANYENRDNMGEPRPDFLYHNNGNGTFTDVSASAGIRDEENQCGRGVNWGDFDNDGDLDIYVSNYRLDRNYLWQNNGDGTFTEVGREKNVAGDKDQEPDGEDYYGHTIGSAWADMDNDLDLDMFVANLAHNNDPVRGPICDNSKLYRNDGEENNYTFTNIIDESGIENKDFPNSEDQLYSGPAWGDIDNDGDLDLYITQVYADIDYAYSYLYRNNGNNTFTDITVSAGVRVWDAWGLAWADYDNDGDLDLIVGGRDGSNSDENPKILHLFRNNGNNNSWLAVKLEGKKFNRAGIGARITVITENGDKQIREVEGGMGTCCSENSLQVEFGFGTYQGKVDVEIRWADNEIQKLYGVSLNQVLKVNQGQKIPDLEVKDIYFSDDYPNEGDRITVYADIEEIKGADVNSADIYFYYGGNKLIDKTKISVLGGRTKTTFVEWIATDEYGSGACKQNIKVVIKNVSPFECEIKNNENSKIIDINQKPTIELIQPNGGENWSENQKIKWNAEDENSKDRLTIKLEYSNDYGKSWTEIAKDLSNNGEYMWDTRSVENGKYLVKVEVNDGKLKAYDISDDIFTIENAGEPPYIEIKSPNGGEIWKETQKIEWYASGEGDIKIDILYSNDGGNTWFLIAKDLENNGYYFWNTTLVPDGDNYLIKIIAKTTTAGSDISNTTFTIDNPHKPIVTILSPIGGEIWRGLHNILWNATDEDNDILTIKIELSNNRGVSWKIIADDEENDGVYLWNTSNYENGYYKIKITATDDSKEKLFKSVESGIFEINDTINSAPIVEILEPEKDKIYGNKILIEWNAVDNENDLLEIDIQYKKLGEDWKYEIKNTENDGIYEWDITSLSDGKYLVKIIAKEKIENGFIVENTSDIFYIDNNNPPEVTLLADFGDVVSGVVEIKWKAIDLEGEEITIELWWVWNNWQESGKISSNEKNDGTYFWDTTVLTDNIRYKILIIAKDSNGLVGIDYSKEFQIKNNNDPEIDLLTDFHNEICGIVEIRWIAKDYETPKEDLVIEIHCIFNESEYKVIAKDEENDGSYLWDTTAIENGNNYRIAVLVFDKDKNFNFVISDCFSVNNHFGIILTAKNYKITVNAENNQAEVSIIVKNDGVFNDTILLSTAVDKKDWEVEIVKSVQLNSNESKEVKLKIIASEHAVLNEVCEIFILAYSEYNINISSEIRLTAVVGQKFAFEIFIDTKSQKIRNGVANYIITLKNTGNCKERIILEISGLRDGWGAELEFYKVILKMGESKDIMLTVIPPQEFKEETNRSIILEIIANIKGSDEIKKLSVNTTVLEVEKKKDENNFISFIGLPISLIAIVGVSYLIYRKKIVN